MRRHLTLILTLILAVAALVLPGAANAGYSPFRISTVSISHDKLHLTLFFPRAGRVDAHPVQPAQQFQQGEARQPRGQRPVRTACSRSRNVERSAGHTYPRTLCRDRHTWPPKVTSSPKTADTWAGLVYFTEHHRVKATAITLIQAIDFCKTEK